MKNRLYLLLHCNSVLDFKKHSVKEPVNYSLNDLTIYFLKLGSWSYGGPVALVGYRHRDLVEKNHWLSYVIYKLNLSFSPTIFDIIILKSTYPNFRR